MLSISAVCWGVEMCTWCTRVFILQYFQAGGVPGRHLYSRSEILATDECSRAAHISRVVQISKQAAQATGGGADSVHVYSTWCVCFTLSFYCIWMFVFYSLQQISTLKKTYILLKDRAICKSSPSSITSATWVRLHIPLWPAVCCGGISVFFSLLLQSDW